MTRKDNAKHQAALRERERAAGIVRVLVRIPADRKAELHELAEQWRTVQKGPGENEQRGKIQGEKISMTAAQDAKQLGMSLGRMTYSDTRRIINHENKPWYVAKDGRVLQQFRTAAERAEWLEGQVQLRDLP